MVGERRTPHDRAGKCFRKTLCEALKGGGGSADGEGQRMPEARGEPLRGCSAAFCRFQLPFKGPMSISLVFHSTSMIGFEHRLRAQVLRKLETDLYPHHLCDYLFDLSQRFNQFYENCSVNNAESNELRCSRASLCAATAETLRVSLKLLGIGVLDRL